VRESASGPSRGRSKRRHVRTWRKLTPAHPLVVPGHTAAMLSGAFLPMPAVAPFTSRFNAFSLEALHECNHLFLFSFGHLKFCQSCGGASKEDVPIAFTDPHASVGERHVPATIINRAARACAEEIYKELFLTHYTIFPAVRPETAKLWIALKSRQQIVRHSVIAACPPTR
jgi:hypothetical protein